MKKIGNIIFNDELINHTQLEFINYINLSENSSLEYDELLPTLFVGWVSLKEIKNKINILKSQNINILEKEIKEYHLYWEFSFEEKKADHVSGVELFCINVPYYFFNKKYDYFNIDPVINKINTIDDIIKILPQTLDQVYIYKDEMIYCLYNKNIYGIDLNMFEFFQFDKSKIVNSLPVDNFNVISDLDGQYYKDLRKTYEKFEGLKRYMVLLLSNN